MSLFSWLVLSGLGATALSFLLTAVVTAGLLAATVGVAAGCVAVLAGSVSRLEAWEEW